MKNIVLVGALLLFVAVMAGKVAYRFGAPALLLFLGVGMMFGLDFISYRSVDMTQFIGMIALCIILFTGGMDTKFSDVKPIIGPGVGWPRPAWRSRPSCWRPSSGYLPPLGIEMPFPLALLLALDDGFHRLGIGLPSCEARKRGCANGSGRCSSSRVARTTWWPT